MIFRKSVVMCIAFIIGGTGKIFFFFNEEEETKLGHEGFLEGVVISAEELRVCQQSQRC